MAAQGFSESDAAEIIQIWLSQQNPEAIQDQHTPPGPPPFKGIPKPGAPWAGDRAIADIRQTLARHHPIAFALDSSRGQFDLMYECQYTKAVERELACAKREREPAHSWHKILRSPRAISSPGWPTIASAASISTKQTAGRAVRATMASRSSKPRTARWGLMTPAPCSARSMRPTPSATSRGS